MNVVQQVQDETIGVAMEAPVVTEQQQQHQQHQHSTDEIGSATVGNVDNTNQDVIVVVEEEGEGEDDNDPYIRQWKESPFAIGISYPTWHDEEIRCCLNMKRRYRSLLCISHADSVSDSNSRNSIVHQRMQYNASPMWCTPLVCRLTPFRRVGNMVVLFQRVDDTVTTTTTTTNDDNGQQQQQHRQTLVCMLGPYWPVLVCVTLPLLVGIAVIIGIYMLPNEHIAIIIIFILLQSTLIFSLLNVSLRDPGVLYRYRTQGDIPIQQNNNTNTNTNTNEQWVWSDQALTYRPKNATYDRDCACVIENFDHTCPWTGTAIGKKNLCWFHVFVTLVGISILFDAYILTFGQQ